MIFIVSMMGAEVWSSGGVDQELKPGLGLQP